MLWTIAVVLIILWLLGLMSGYTMGYFIHIPAGHCHCRDPGQNHPGAKTHIAVRITVTT